MVNFSEKYISFLFLLAYDQIKGAGVIEKDIFKMCPIVAVIITAVKN